MGLNQDDCQLGLLRICEIIPISWTNKRLALFTKGI